MKRKYLSIVMMAAASLLTVSCGPSDPRAEEQVTTTKVPPGDRSTTNIGGTTLGDTATRGDEVLLNHTQGENHIGRDPQNIDEEALTNDVDSVTNHP